MRGRDLTIRQAEVLTAVRRWVAAHGLAPTGVELGRIIGTSTSGAGDAMRVLIRKGCLRRGGVSGPSGLSRTLHFAKPEPGPARVHQGSAVVAYENGEAAGVAYRVTEAVLDE